MTPALWMIFIDFLIETVCRNSGLISVKHFWFYYSTVSIVITFIFRFWPSIFRSLTMQSNMVCMKWLTVISDVIFVWIRGMSISVSWIHWYRRGSSSLWRLRLLELVHCRWVHWSILDSEMCDASEWSTLSAKDVDWVWICVLAVF